MGTRHKHADIIHAWAEGEEIEYRAIPGEGEWCTLPPSAMTWCDIAEYRIKPKIVKREGWVNVYKAGPIWAAALSHAFYTKKEADQDTVCDRVACIRIEWEEEV